MKVLFKVFLVSILMIELSIATAADYGVCNEAIKPNDALISPVQQVTKIILLSQFVLGVKIDDDSMMTVSYDVNPDLFSLLRTEPVAFVGVVEGKNLAGKSDVWMKVWISDNDCRVNNVGGSLIYSQTTIPESFQSDVENWKKINLRN